MKSNTKLTVFVIDDESAIQRLLRRALEAYGYRVYISDYQKNLLQQLNHEVPELVLLDIALGSSVDGIALCHQIRKQSNVPIIMLTVQNDKGSKLAALNAGADDYITKPFDVDELEARMRAVLRRSAYKLSPTTSGIIKVEELTIDFLKRRAFLGEREIHLTNKEYALLKLLASQRGKIVTFEKILKEIWFLSQSKQAQHKLRTHITSLRKKLKDNPLEPRFIFNEMGIGYRFVDLAD